jgi:hypothetical protein
MVVAQSALYVWTRVSIKRDREKALFCDRTLSECSCLTSEFTAVRHVKRAVPWLRRLAAGLPLRRPGFDPESVHVGFVVDKVALGQVFSPSSSVFPCQFHSTGAPLLGKGQKIIISSFIGSHNKPQGCGASVASAAGPFTAKKKGHVNKWQ